jgi:hypothetical protein
VRILYGLLAVACVAVAVRFIWAGLQEWRGGGGRPLSRDGFLVDEQTRAGWDRSGLIMGLVAVFIAVMLADAGIINFNDPVRAEVLVFAAAVVGLVICVGLYSTILFFNRPKFLVPPRHRGELGAFAAQRRQREGRHAR